YQNSLLTGTILENSRTSLRKWFLAFYYVSETRHSITAKMLQQKIQVTYKTAWLMLAKIRRVLSEADMENKLKGSIVINPTTSSHPSYLPNNKKRRTLRPALISACLKEDGTPAMVKIST